jgi:hypothetical protein
MMDNILTMEPTLEVGGFDSSRLGKHGSTIRAAVRILIDYL